MIHYLTPNRLEDYRAFLRIKQLPSYRIRGRMAWFPDEYAAQVFGETKPTPLAVEYEPHEACFDYQRDISRVALARQKFAVFADCGLGKTLILLEFAKHATASHRQRTLIVSPLMVIEQTIGEAARFYGDALPIEHVKPSGLQAWMDGTAPAIGITNYEAIRDGLTKGNLGALILDESSVLKSHYGKWGTRLIELGGGLSWKLCLTGTPAPNDRIEYANHAVFLDQFPTVNSFLARYFVNRGQTMERWELRPHALRPFYRSLSHWCIFLTDPATYGWQGSGKQIPPINVHIEPVGMTEAQWDAVREQSGMLFASRMGGISTRGKMAQIGKGFYRKNGKQRDVDTHKYDHMREMLSRWPDESTIIWCWFNEEQDRVAATFPDAASIDGSTPHDERMRLIDEFKRGERKVLISKPKILGYGLNLQVATRQVFSSLIDSYESYYQAVKRSNRYGSTKPLNVHIPICDVEEAMVENVLRKAHRVDADSREQEALFKELGYAGLEITT